MFIELVTFVTNIPMMDHDMQNIVPEPVLIQQLKASSEKAFDEIYNLYAGRLYTFCMKYIKIREDAEEIVEDVFVKLWKIRKTIRQQQSLKALLFTMAHHAIISSYRQTLSSPEYAAFVSIRERSDASDASSLVEYNEFVDHLHHEMSLLPNTQQQVIYLSKYEGLSNEEIAQKLNLSRQTVRNQLSVGLKALRRSLLPLSALFLFFMS